ncbi:MAG: ImmA/IrrE family metallo-endopeptidase [Lachnospiraceae bacterium]|nr:ImmA/IrrE family metallo-endopeptidase [Lachnospiraceae bacterium]
MKDKGEIFCRLMHLAKKRGLRVSFFPFNYYNGRLKGDHIGIRQTMESIDDYNYSLAHEIAHYFLHYDKGNTITSDRHEEYEEQADRAAKMLLAALSADGKDNEV